MDEKINLLGGSADLTGSNNTYVKQMKVVNKNNFDANYLRVVLENIAWQKIVIIKNITKLYFF